MAEDGVQQGDGHEDYLSFAFLSCHANCLYKHEHERHGAARIFFSENSVM